MHEIPTGVPSAETQRSTRSPARLLLTALLASMIDFGAAWVLARVPLGPTARIAVALLPLPANIALLVLILRAIRRLDEFQKRIHFEAVVVAFLATGLAVFVYGYLQKAHAAGPFNVLFIWPFMVGFYAIGYAVALRHYK
jgi:hypothetical protein